jgi:hypothetical protein
MEKSNLENSLTINNTSNTIIEVIEESENEGNLITLIRKKPSDPLIKINEVIEKNDSLIIKQINKNTNFTYNIPESCSLSQREFLLNANNPQYKNNNGTRFKDDHTGNTLNTYESLAGNFFVFLKF